MRFRRQNPQSLLAVILCFSSLCLPIEGNADARDSQSPGKSLNFSLPGIDGRAHTQAEFSGSKAAVFLFIAAECPISNRYAPEVNSIVAGYSRQNIAFYAVHSEPDLPRETAAKHASEFGFQFPVLLDPAQVLATRFGVRMTPTVLVTSPSGEVLYRGRIDNRYLDFGKFRNAGITPDLRNALDSVLKGRPVELPLTKTVGCAIPEPRG